MAVYDPGANALTVFRRPAELRADSRASLTDVVTRGVAVALGEAPGFAFDERGEAWPDRDG